MQSCRALRWLEDREDNEVEFEVEVLDVLLLVVVAPDVDRELTRFTVEDDDSM